MTVRSGSSPRLMVLGGSVLQIPAIARARELGYVVAVLDRDPDAPGTSIADVFYKVSTIDVSGVCNVAREFRPDGIITIGTDMPMRALASAAQALGLPAPSPRAVYNSTDKGAMAEALQAFGVPTPSTELVTTVAGLNASAGSRSFPLIVKPVDSSGSRGVSLVETPGQLHEAFRHAFGHSRNGQVLVQEYMRGPEVSVEGFCYDGEVTVVAVTDKTTTGAPHFVELGHSQPSRLPAETLDRVSRVVVQSATALGLTDCAIHAELIITDDGPKVVEIGARLGGDFITSHLVPLSTGVDMVEALIDISLGRRPQLNHRHARGSAVRFLDRPGSSRFLDAVTSSPGVALVAVAERSEVKIVRSSTDRLGHVVAWADTAAAAVAVAEAALDRLTACES